MGKKKKGGKKKAGGKGGKKGKHKDKKKKNDETHEEEIVYLPEVIETRETSEFSGGAAFRSFSLAKETMHSVVKSYGHSFVTRSDLEIPKPLPRVVVEESALESVDPGDTGEIESIETSKDDIDKASTMDEESNQLDVSLTSKTDPVHNFHEALRKESTITVGGSKRWSKKKQFRHEVKEIFGGKERNIPGFRTFTKDVARAGLVKWKFHEM